MNSKNTELNKANAGKNKNNKLSIINKKLIVLDSDIHRLYQRYSLAKKERQIHENDQKCIINRIKYLEDEEKKMQLKCKKQMEKIKCLTKKLGLDKDKKNKKSKKKLNLNKNADSKNNTKNSFFKKESTIPTLNKIGEEYKANSSFNEKNVGNIWIKNNITLKDNSDDFNKISDIFLNEKVFSKTDINNKDELENEEKEIEIEKEEKKEKEKEETHQTNQSNQSNQSIQSNKSNESSNDEEKEKIKNNFVLEKPNNICETEINIENEIPATAREIQRENKNIENNINKTKNNSVSKYKYIHRNNNFKKSSIKYLKTSKNKKRMNHSLKPKKIYDFNKYKTNKHLIDNQKNKYRNNSFIIARHLTSDRMSKKEGNLINNNRKLKYSKSIEVKKKPIKISKEKGNKESRNKFKKIKIFKKNINSKDNKKPENKPINNISKIKNKINKLIVNREKNVNDANNISYDFIINNDKIIYHNNHSKDKKIKGSNTSAYNNLNRNYIFIKNEEKMKNIIYNNKGINN